MTAEEEATRKREVAEEGDDASLALADVAPSDLESHALVGTEDELISLAESGTTPDDHVPVQLGYLRFVYAAYMAAAIIVSFIAEKIGHVAWYRLGQWNPSFGEPHDEVLYPFAAAIGIGVSLYYWRKPEAREYSNEVAEELSKVSWPTRKEVMNSTTVVVLTTIFATVFFALMDQFWKYVTDKIYSF